MSLKSVEMQIAVPRVTEASKIQHEHHQRPAQDQALLGGEQIKQSLHDAQRSTGVDETADAAVRDGGGGSPKEKNSENQGQKDQVPEQPAEHPFKGRNFDISL